MKSIRVCAVSCFTHARSMGNLYFCQVPDALSDKVLELECPETGRVLECYAERIAVVDGQRYLAAYPKARRRILDTPW